MYRRGQSWSVDAVIGVVIFGFVGVVIASFTILSGGDVSELQRDAERVSYSLSESTGTCGTVLQNDSLDEDTLGCLYDQPYDDVRKQFRFDSDFCLFLEDQNGQLITVKNRTGWGSSELEVGGFPCGQKYS